MLKFAPQQTASTALDVHGMKVHADVRMYQRKGSQAAVKYIVRWLSHRYCAGTCYNGECEGLHEEADVRKQQAAWKIPDRARLIIAAGM